jgi:phospholipid transport system substrate-binding protein
VILAPETEGSLEERVTAVRGLVNDVFDFEGAAALALGRRWGALAAPERAEFGRLYADLIERAYLAWVGSKARVGAGGVTSRWVDETVAGDTATVKSTLLTRAGAEFPIDYGMVRRAGAWVVRDVEVDGLSLAANYHVQFERVLQTGSYDELIARLRERAGPVARAQASAAMARAIRAMVAAPSPPGPPPVFRASAVTPPPLVAPPPVVADAPAPAPVMVAAYREPVEIATDATPSAVIAAATRVETPDERPVSTPPVAREEPPVAAPAAARVAGPAPAVAWTAAPRREFWVQVGAFRSADAATRMVQRLRRHAVTLALGGDRVQRLTRVLVGPFVARAAAASTMRELQASGISAFIAGPAE